MELHHLDRIRRREKTCELPGHIGLAGSGRTMKNDLSLVVQQLLDTAEVIHVEQQAVGELIERRGGDLLDDWLDDWLDHLATQVFEESRLLFRRKLIGDPGRDHGPEDSLGVEAVAKLEAAR